MQMQVSDKNVEVVANVDTDEIFSKFVEPHNKLSRPDLASNKELLDRDRTAYKLLEKSIRHINEYDSLETAAKLISQAKNFLSAYNLEKPLILARKNLQAAHRIMRPRFKTHYTKIQKEQVKRKSINAALEHIADAMMGLKLEEDKRTGNLFDNLTSRASVDLPTRVKHAKAKFLVREAPVVVNVKSGSPKGLRSSRLETMLYLMHNATFIGVCVNNIKGDALSFAQEKALSKFGSSVYEEPIYRPSDGLSWFLLMNFSVDISYAAFPDYVRASYANINTEGQNFSYEDYVKGVLAKESIDQALKAQRLKKIREAFEETNKELYESIANNKSLIDFKLDQIEALKYKFHRITSLEDGESDGLKSNQYETRFNTRFSKIAVDNYIDSILPFSTIREDVRKQRIEAREIYHTIKMLLNDINELRKKNKLTLEQINNLKRQEAIKHGIFGRQTVVELEDS